MTILRYEHDTEADALYIYLSEAAYAYGEELSPERRVDFSSDGKPVGVELPAASDVYEVASIAEAIQLFTSGLFGG